MASYVTDAIVISARRYGEADRLVRLFTLERGKIGAIAKSARKPKSTLRGGSESFVRGEFELAEGKSLDIIRQIEIHEAMLSIRDDWKRLQYAGHVCEITDKLTEEKVPDRQMYSLLSGALSEIQDGIQTAVVKFKVGMLKHQGIFPDLTGCANCGSSKVKGEIHLDMRSTGFLCSDCARDTQVFRPVPMDVLKLLYELGANGESTKDLNEETINSTDDILTDLLQGFLQAGFKTVKGIKKTRNSE